MSAQLTTILPSHIRMDIHCWPEQQEGVVTYFAPAADLIQARCATADMLAPGKKGVPRYDKDGYSFTRQPCGKKVRIGRRRPIDLLHELPGVTRSAIDERLRHQEEMRQRREAEDKERREANRAAAWKKFDDECYAPKSPADWLGRRLRLLISYMDIIRDLGDCEIKTGGVLDLDYDADAADMLAYKERAEAASKELAALLGSIKIRKTAKPALKLVINNA